MSDSPPPAATTPSPDETTTMSAGQPPSSPTESDKTVAPMQDQAGEQEFLPKTGAAIFSTELCTRAPRPKSGPPYPPVIARGSDHIKAVVDAAHYWQAKFKWQCLCIFPNHGWSVDDLWDAEDIHVESRSFCEDMLTFIGRDTYYAAKQFGEDWLRAHPDRLDFVTGDMGGAFDPNEPLAIVDKIFIYGETKGFPRTFLYHVGQIIRMTLNEASQAKKGAVAANHVQQSSHAEQPGIQKVAVDATAAATEGPVAAKAQASMPSNSASSKKNRKISRSRPRKLTVSKESSSAVNTSVVPPAGVPNLAGPRAASKRAPSHGLPQPVHYTDPMGSYIGGMAGPPMMSPNVHPQVLKVAKGKARNMESGSYNQPMPPQGWVENVNRVSSGQYSRHTSGTMSNVQSPHYIPATMAMGQPMMMLPNTIPPYAQGPTMMSPALPNQHFDPAMVQRVMMPGQPMPMQTPPMGQAYLHQPPHAYGIRGDSTGVMTNNAYYSNTMPAQHIAPRGPLPRRASNFNNSGVLYDPYNGANPKFNDATAYNGAKKFAQNSFTNQPGRPRKTSNSADRPGYASHGIDRSGNMPSNGSRRLDSNYLKARTEDDPAITGDPRSGCSDVWIGPENKTVTELFVGDLPEGVEPNELKQLFEQHVGVSPSHIEIKSALVVREFNNRWHAFVSFSSPSDTKKALQIRDHSPSIREGSVAVVVTVPRRFFQRLPISVRKGSFMAGSHNGSSRAAQTDEQNARGVMHKSSHDEESVVTNSHASSERPQYSPQDARSDLHKTSTQKSDSGDTARSGSPEAHKSRRKQISPTKKQTSKRASPIETKSSGKKDSEEVIGDAGADTANLPAADAVTARGDSEAAGEPAKDTIEPLEAVTTNEPGTKEPSTSLTNTTSTVGDATDVVGDVSTQPVEDQKPPNVAHDEENPQTQSSLEPSPVETRTPVHDPPQIAEDVPAAEEPAMEVKDTEGTNSDKAPATSPLQPAEDIASDDEANNDVSFHSAQESPTDPGNVDLKPQVRDEPIPANQGLTSIESAAEGSLDDENIVPQTAIEEIPQDIYQAPPAIPVQDSTFSETRSTLEDDTQVKTASTHDVPAQPVPAAPVETVASTPAPNVAAAPAQTVGAMTAPSAVPAVEALKKSGAQQVESLSPFAKPSKIQQRKDKESKKKQQKKAEAEKAEKSKATSFAKPNEVSAAKAKIETLQASDTPTVRPNMPVESTATARDIAGQAAQGSKKSKGKGKSTTLSTVHQDQKTESVDQDSASQIAKAGPLEQPPFRAGAPNAQPPDAISAEVVDGQDDHSDSVRASPGSPTKSSNVKAPSKKKKPVSAVPNLNLPPQKSSTHSKATQLSSTGAPTPLSLHVNVSKVTEPDLSPSPSSPLKAASIASSATLQAEDTPLVSPSLTGDDFVTQLQTPIAPVLPQIDKPNVETSQTDVPEEEAPKKKKKKPKKRSKKSAKSPAKASEPSVLVDNYSDDSEFLVFERGGLKPASDYRSSGLPSARATGSAGAMATNTTAPNPEDHNPSGSSSGIDEDYDFYDPFTSQLSHIEAIRRGLKNPDSYFAKVNARMETKAECEAAQADLEAAKAENAKSLSEASLLRQVQGYMKENGSQSVSGGKKLSRKDLG